MYIEPRLPDHTDIWTANLNSRIVHCFGEIEETISPEALQIMVDWLKVGSIY